MAFRPEKGVARKGAVELSLVNLRDLPVRAIKWIEKPFLAEGELHILQGHGGTGKGALTCLWAAEASRRGEHVIMVIAEDDLAAQIKPRLVAAEADLANVHPLRVTREGVEDALLIPDDLEVLEHLVDQTQARLVVIDPLLTHIAGNTNSYKDHEVKRVLTPLSRLAQRTGSAIVAVHHFKKDTSQGARLSGQGSTAFYTTARITLSMVKDGDGLHVLEVSKSNIGPEGDGQNFLVRVEQIPAADGDAAEVPRLIRDGAATITVDELLANPKAASKTEKARQLILEAVRTEGQIDAEQLDAQVAASVGLSERTVRNARMKLGQQGLLRAVSVRGEKGVQRWRVALADNTPTDVSRGSRDSRDGRDSGKPEALEALPALPTVRGNEAAA